MTIPARSPRGSWVLAALGASAICSAAAVWIEMGAAVEPWLGGCLVSGAAIGVLTVRVAARRADRITQELTALRALVASHAARLRDVGDSHGRFVGNIAHEIKTPLTIALAQLDQLLRASTDAIAVRGHAESIAEDLQHLSDLVESFLRLARPFGQGNTDHHVPVDVNDFVVESIRRSQALGATHDVKLVLNLAEVTEGASDPEVLGDAVLLEAMLENLVRNGVRFSPRGSKVRLQVEVDDQTVRIGVVDQGRGIAPENREAIFDWFFRSPGVTVPSTGTGFGLAIARRVAEHHGGSIELREATEQGGCEFAITLPRHHRAPTPLPVPGVDPGTLAQRSDALTNSKSPRPIAEAYPGTG